MVPEQNNEEDKNVQPQALPIRRRPRKRTPQRLHFDEADIDVVNSASMALTPSHDTASRQASSRTIEGLGPFGTYYTPDFDVKPLPIGTCFASSTFIGSGEFEKALAVNSRDMDLPSLQRTTINIGQKVLQLSSWTEEASTQLSELFAYCIQRHHNHNPSAGVTSSAQASQCTRKLVYHISTTLYFLDSIDRSSFLSSLATKVEHLIQELEASTSTSTSLSSDTVELDLLKYMAVLVGQGYLLCDSHIVSPELKSKFAQLLQRTVVGSARRLFRNGLVQIWALHQRATSSSFVDAGIGSDEHEAESIVIYHHLLSRLALPGLSFTDLINTGLAQRSLITCTKVSMFDLTWHDLFAILPLLSLDESGILVRSSRATGDLGTLDAVKEILSAVFELYRTHIFELSRPINPYIRATLHRCLQLVRNWNWCRCEAALSTIFDFFARDGFALLKNEEGTNSPHFLKELDKGVMPAMEAGDRSFDIFLKALYVGLHNLRSALPDKKIRNIAWRFIPNHGRQHENDSTLKPADLQALRNTHDLLCVLYAASPTGFRPNLDLLRNLANFTNSHSEICKVNICSWANLVRYQLSTTEGTASLTPFVAWYNDMIIKLVQQHRQARLEAQAQLEASSVNGAQLGKIFVESIIASNQRQIGGILVMALVALGDVVQHTNDDSSAIALFEQVALTEVLALYGSEDTRITNVLTTTLEAYQAAYQRIRHPNTQTARPLTPQQSEDSQDFGDFPDMDDIEDITITGEVQHQAFDPALTDPVQQLLSNCFGTESGVDDNLLTEVVDVWVEACNLLVFKHQRSWSYFLNPQSSGSWNQLRDTDSKRKYFSYYITTILDIAPNVIELSSNVIISAWLVSLVERESTLKYQHRLTAALLNACPNHPLLSNLPFVKDTASSRYEITLTELSQRRVAVLSSVFSSMRTCLESSFITSTSNTQQLRHEYQDLLQQLMTAMKKNYQEIQQGSSTRGSYVDFVQRVIEELQQYTSDICPVDRFFTDSAAFPLPASDPTYVVGRLKSYGLKADDLGEQKKLAIFFQAVCERAAVDNQQVYLTEQLVKSVKGCREGGAAPRSTLRSLLFTGILPAYIEVAFSSDCGWILVIPILEALTRMLEELLFRFSLSDEAGRNAVIGMVTDVATSICTAFRVLVGEPGRLHKPCFLVTLSVTYNSIEALASIVDYVNRYSYSAVTAVESVVHLQRFGRDILGRIEREDYGIDFNNDNQILVEQSSIASNVKFGDVKSFCRQELNKSLTTNWSKQDGKYFAFRGNSRRAVNLEVGDYGEESQGAVASIRKCLKTMENLPSFGQPRHWKRLEVRLKDPDLIV